MEEKKIYILLTDTGTLFTRMIKLYTKKPYNHASISCDSNLSTVYSFGRKKPRNPFIGGFVRENTKTGLFKHARGAIYCCTVNEEQIQKINNYLQKLDEHKDLYRYNFIGLFGVMLNKPVKRENAFFCSQFVATVLKECDIITFQKPLSLVTPHDLQEAEKFQFVYQGKLADYDMEEKHAIMTNP
ncbi:hypothetical protein [Virgibacillus ainsalahensis]